MSVEDYHDMFDYDIYMANKHKPDFLLGVSDSEVAQKEADYERLVTKAKASTNMITKRGIPVSYAELRESNPKAYESLMNFKRTNIERKQHLIRTNQMSPKRIKTKTENNFYVGAPWLLNDQRGYVGSFEDAVRQAKEKLKASGQPQTIVQIVAVVEAVTPPVRIRKIR